MKRTAKTTLWLLVVLSIAFAGYLAYRRLSVPSAAERYRTQPLSRGTVAQTVSANGTLNPVTLVSVGTQVSGTVRKLYVDFNSRVKQGQVLLELDDALLRAQIAQDEANIKNAEASVDLTRANEQRTRDLFTQEYVSRQDLDQAVQARKSAEAQLELARAQRRKDQVNLSYTVIRSPVAGVVVDRVVDVGQTVAASFQTPTLIKIAQDLSKMQIDTSFAEADVGSIKVGQTARFTVDAFPTRSFRGAVKEIRLNPTTVQNVVTYDVVVSVSNPEEILLPGMTAYVSIVVARRADALLVPNAALRFRPAQAGAAAAPPRQPSAAEQGQRPAGRKREGGAAGTVYRLVGDKLEPVPVTVGITDGRNTEVTGGPLAAGDAVVVGENLAAEEGVGGRTMRLRIF